MRKRRRSKLALILVCSIAFQALIMTEPKAGNILQQGAHETVTFTSYVDTYTLAKWIGWPWLITSANIDASGLWIMTYNIDQTWVTEMPCRQVYATGLRSTGGDSTELFSTRVYGTYWAGGEGGGGTPTYSISANFLETLAIIPSELIVPLDTTANFTLYNFGNYRSGSYWQIPPSATWISSHPSYSAPTDVAGEFWITAAPHADGGDAISIPEVAVAALKVVEVAKIVASSSSASKDIESTKDSSSLTNNERLLTMAGENVTITATPNPADIWPETYPRWPSQQYWGSSTYTFGPATGQTIEWATCGNDKAIKVLAATITHGTPTYNSNGPTIEIPYTLSPSQLEGFLYIFGLGILLSEVDVVARDLKETVVINIDNLATGTGDISFHLCDPVTGVIIIKTDTGCTVTEKSKQTPQRDYLFCDPVPLIPGLPPVIFGLSYVFTSTYKVVDILGTKAYCGTRNSFTQTIPAATQVWIIMGAINLSYMSESHDYEHKYLSGGFDINLNEWQPSPLKSYFTTTGPPFDIMQIEGYYEDTLTLD